MFPIIQFRIFFSSCLLSKNIEVKIYKTILSVILYGHEMWFVIKEEHRLTLSENRMLRIFRPRKEQVTDGKRNQHNTEPHSFHSSSSTMKVIEYLIFGS